MTNYSLEQFNYELPEAFIAQIPVEPRDSSKLLVFNQNKISETIFSNLLEVLPENATLIFNDAKVIPARIFLQNKNGAKIELFLLQPFQQEYTASLNSTSETIWECLIGNKKKWALTDSLNLNIDQTQIHFSIISDQVVKIKWNNGLSFIEILTMIGSMPLPPYIKRNAIENDTNRYQTVYSKTLGSVAAPTAGLHFTKQLIDKISEKSIPRLNVTLHVSAGTFLPVKTENITEHPMHHEFFSCNVSTIHSIIQSHEKLIAVGTTSIRVMESLYWVGFKIIKKLDHPLDIEQFLWRQYSEERELPSLQESYTAIKDYMQTNQLSVLSGQTSIMIMPGYQFKVIKGLVTNFHQPKSTLLFLVSALIGEDWKKIYQYAITNKFRFLSYGDSSLLLP
ncbi:MAG: S-adenosylmethionine:tRNA ribosyltransferase-isomerase [Bacteroidota bacterium]|nr:S-adenosylmethionine:tRNA ribosyltransferase-isomerase [Bacteroidota bacterium]